MGAIWSGFVELRCLLAFQASGFDPGNPDTFPLVMDENVLQRFHLTGEWIGVTAIQEYLNFYGADFVKDFESIIPGDPGIITLDTSASTLEQCVVTASTHARLRNKAQYSTTGAEQCVDMVSSSKLRFEVTSLFFFLPGAMRLTTWDVWTPDAFITWLFNSIDSNNTADLICDTIVNVCQEEGETMETCKSKLAALPANENGAYLDGDSRYCRILHGAYAQNNPLHCPHVTFGREIDANGLFKCDVSKFAQVTDIFSEAEVAAFTALTLPYDNPSNPQVAVYEDGQCPVALN